MERRKFTREFKLEAVRLIRDIAPDAERYRPKLLGGPEQCRSTATAAHVRPSPRHKR